MDSALFLSTHLLEFLNWFLIFYGLLFVVIMPIMMEVDTSGNYERYRKIIDYLLEIFSFLIVISRPLFKAIIFLIVGSYISMALLALKG